MAPKISYSDIKHLITLPSNWDLTYLKKFAMRDGSTFDQVVVRIGTALALFNRSLAMGYWSQYYNLTTNIESEYATGGDNSILPEYSEFERPDPIIGDLTGHMLPLKDYGGSLGWTYLGLRRGRMSMIDADVRSLIDRSRNSWQKRFMQRLFSSAAETVGAAGKSHPFADGGTADSKFVPEQYDGKTFDNTHNHYLRYTADATGRTDSLAAMMLTLLEHGFTSPFDLVIPEADVASWAAQTEFKKPERSILSTAGVEVRGAVPEEEYIGVVETAHGWARVKKTARLATGYSGMFKPAGYNVGNNVLTVRAEEGYPLGLALVALETRFPLHDAIALFTFGVGVNNRLAGTATKYAASGNYSDPTIS